MPSDGDTDLFQACLAHLPQFPGNATVERAECLRISRRSLQRMVMGDRYIPADIWGRLAEALDEVADNARDLFIQARKMHVHLKEAENMVPHSHSIQTDLRPRFSLTLFDRGLRGALAYQAAFQDIMDENLKVFCGDFSSLKGTFVSPANSFGFMDGGIDGAYTLFFGPNLQDAVQREIKSLPFGELLVGQARRIHNPALIIAPTMRVPSRICDPFAIYLAARAAFSVAINGEHICMPGMGTGCGNVDPTVSARLVRKAYDDVLNPPPFPRSWEEAHKHQFA